MKLSELNLLAVGNTIQIAGAVYVGDGKMYLCLFPEDRGSLTSGEGRVLFLSKDRDPHSSFAEAEVDVIDMDADDWTKFLRQTDVMETEILTKASDGTLAKAIYRKSQRQIDQVVSWQVFKRDGYACRYCANASVPLTVDHLVRWEEGGPTTTDNLVAACKKCNKTRGNASYEDWMKHPYYLQVSKALLPEVRASNEAIIGRLHLVKRNVHTRAR